MSKSKDDDDSKPIKGLVGLYRAWKKKKDDSDDEDWEPPVQKQNVALPTSAPNVAAQTSITIVSTPTSAPNVAAETSTTIVSTPASAPKVPVQTSTAKAVAQPSTSKVSKQTSTPKVAEQSGTKTRKTFLLELPGFRMDSLFSIVRLNRNDKEYASIFYYVQNSQDHGFKMRVEEIVRVTRNGEEGYNSNPKWKGRFRLELWHGTKKDHVAKILQTGFRKPNPNGQMFGSGIYFADRASKSVRYGFGQPPPADPDTNSHAYLFLCDVLVGKAYNAKNPHQDFELAPETTKVKFDSVKCTGEYVPDMQGQVEHDGVKWPIGMTIKNTKYPSYTVRYNEYIIYNPENVKINYVVKVLCH